MPRLGEPSSQPSRFAGARHRCRRSIKPAGDAWLKSIHHPAGRFVPLDSELVADTRAISQNLRRQHGLNSWRNSGAVLGQTRCSLTCPGRSPPCALMCTGRCPRRRKRRTKVEPGTRSTPQVDRPRMRTAGIRSCNTHFSALAVRVGATSLVAPEIAARIKCRLPIRREVHYAGGSQTFPASERQRQTGVANCSTNKSSASGQNSR